METWDKEVWQIHSHEYKKVLAGKKHEKVSLGIAP